jgi:hypothetical protein
VTREEQIAAAEAAFRAAAERETQAHRDARTAELAWIEAKGEGDSHDARFIRAFLAGDYATMHRLCVESDAAWRLKYGTTHAEKEAEIAAEVERMRAEVSP